MAKQLSLLDFILTTPALPLLTPDEIFQKADQALLRQLKEDRRVERKTAKTHSKVLGEYFSMWANTTPEGGLLALGVENDGSFTGCSCLSQGEINNREKSYHTFCPECSTESKRIKITNVKGLEDFIILYRTRYKENKVVCDVSGNAFVRIGDERHKLTQDEILELKIDKGQVDIERELSTLNFPQDFRDDLINTFVDGVHKKMNLIKPHSIDEILEHKILGKIEKGIFIPNNACVLLFAKQPNTVFPGCYIRFLRYEGETEETGQRYNVVKDIWIEGCIPELIVGTAKVLESQLREFSRLGEDGKFYTAPEYPNDAWYEAIVNACVHRSYGLKNIPIFVKMYDDRLIVESPGSFPPFVTPENIYNSHHPRNPHLMNAMYFLDFVKCHNEGTRRMRDTMEEMKLPIPEFKESQEGTGSKTVRVTLRNNRKQRKVWIDSAIIDWLPLDIAKSLNQHETRIINFIVENGQINVIQCQKLISRGWHYAKKLLLDLRDRNILIYLHRKDIVRDCKACFKLNPKVTPNGK